MTSQQLSLSNLLEKFYNVLRSVKLNRPQKIITSRATLIMFAAHFRKIVKSHQKLMT